MPSSAPAAPARIVPAVLKDIPAIIALAEATWEPTYRFIISKEQIDYMYRVIYTPASLRRQMLDERHTFLLAHLGGAAGAGGGPAGYASFGPLPDGGEAAGAKAFKLHKIYVLPTRQGQGLGLQLLDAVEQAVRKAGGTSLDLNVNRYNPALAFYERRGFERQREVDVPIGPYFMNDFVLRKALA